jgi:hypothetical protein
VFVPDKPFKPSLTFQVRPEEPAQLKHHPGAPLQGWILALPINFRLGWKGLPGTNTLAHLEHIKIIDYNYIIIDKI